MRDPGAGTTNRPTFTPPRPSVVSANRSPIHTFLAHVAGRPSPAAAKAEQVQAEADRKDTLAKTGRYHQAQAQHVVDTFGDDPFERDRQLRELGFNDKMIAAVRRDHPVTDSSGARTVQTPHGDVHLQKAPSVYSLGPSMVGNNKIGRFLGRLGSQAADIAVQAGPGLIHAGATAGKALLESDRVGMANDPEAKQRLNDRAGPMPATVELGRIAKGTAEQVKADVSDPAGRPGYLAFDLLSLLSGGAGTATRVTAGVRAARAAGEGASVATRAAEGARGFAERPAPQLHPISVRGGAAPLTVYKSLSENPLLRPLQRRFYDRVEGKLNQPTGPSFRQRLEAPGDSSSLNPADRLTVPKKLAGALSIPHRLEQHIFGPEAVLRRGLGATRRTERAVLGAPAEELRAAAGTRLPDGINAKLPARLRRGLSPQEDKAIQAVSILGRHAITNPERAVAILKGYHERAAATALQAATSAADQVAALRHAALDLVNTGRYDDLAGLETRIAELETETRQHAGAHERHTVQAAQFQGTLPVLKAAGLGKASARFTEVLPAARAVSEARAAMLKQAGHLNDESEAWRTSAPAAEYQHVPTPEDPMALHRDVPNVVTRADNPAARQAAASLAELDKHIAKVRDDYRRSAKRLRPKTAGEAHDELLKLEAEHEKMLQTYEKDFMSTKVAPEEADRLLAEHDAKIQAAAQALEHARTGDVGPLTVVGKQGRVTGISESMLRAAKISNAERALKRLERERGRFVEAAKTGKLRLNHDPAETARRNRLGGGVMPTQKEELRAEVERSLEQVLAKHADQPAIAPVVARVARMAQLREGLRLHQEATDPFLGTGKPLTAEQQTQHFGGVPVGADETSRRRLGALLEYRTGLEANLDKAMGQEPKLHTLLDETIRERKQIPDVEGAFRAPLGSHNDPSFGAPFAAVYPGKGGIPPVDAARRDATLNHEFTAGEIKHGDLTGATVDAIANSYVKAARIHSQEGEYDRYWKLSKPTRESDDMVPVRQPKQIPLEFKQELRRIADRPEAAKTLAELERNVGDQLDRYLRGEDLSAADMADLKARGLPDGLWRKTRTGNRVAVPVGTDLSHLGIRWVHRDYIEPPRTPRPTSKPMAAVDFLNDLGRLGVYARGGYVLNLLSNYGMQALEQGHLAPKMYSRAWSLRDTYGSDVASKIEGLVGEGRSRSYNIDHGGLGNATGTLASMWSGLIDRQSRVSNFLYWAHRHGVNLDDKAQVRALFDPANRAKLNDISERANKGMVQFNNLNALERDTLRHLVYFYPWVSRATAWAVRTMVEHPHKTWALSQLAQVAEANRNRDFGKLPKSLEQRGYMPFKIGGKTYMIGTSSVNPFQTVADTGRQLVSPFDPSQPQLAESASPALGFGLDLLTGRDSQGHQLKGGRLKGAIMDTVASGTPQGQALQRGMFGKRIARLLGKRTDYSRQPEARKPTFPASGFMQGLGPLTIGQLYPRPADMTAVQAKQHEEALAAMPPTQRAVARERDVQAKFVGDLRAAKLIDGPTPELAKLFQERLERTAAYAAAAEKAGVPINRLTIRDRFLVDIDLAVKRGLIKPADKATLLANTANMNDAQIKYVRHRFHGAWFTEDHALSVLRGVVRDRQQATAP